MVESCRGQSQFIGRRSELGELEGHLEAAVGGRGAAVVLHGEPGMGKTRLTEELKQMAVGRGLRVLAGGADADSRRPFLMFSRALEGAIEGSLFEELEYTNFLMAFCMSGEGEPVIQASQESSQGLDAGTFSGVLATVQNFIRDSFQSPGDREGSLGRLEIGEMKVLMEHHDGRYVAAVLAGAEHPGMRTALRQALSGIGDGGKNQAALSKLVKARFLVRKDMEGIKLESERLRIADRVLACLSGMAGPGTVLLVLEDIHWADESSMFILNYLARNIGDRNIMLVATARPEMSKYTSEILETMGTDGILKNINLSKLDAANMASLAGGLCSPNAFSAYFLERLAGACGGNPLFAMEILKQMLASGSVHKIDGTYVDTGMDYAIPSTLEDVIQRKLESMDQDAMNMAEYASCIGREFEIPAVCSIASLADPQTALGKLTAAGVIVRNNGTAGFSHALFQEVIYGGIGGRWRAIHHRNIGEYYENAYADAQDTVLYELARHFSRTNERAKAYAYCSRAGEMADASFAAEQAISFHEDALRSAEKLGPGGQEKVAETLAHLGDTYTLMGEFGTAVEKYLLAIGKTVNDLTEADLHRRVADNHIKMGESAKGREECEKGLALLRDVECVEGARLMLARGWGHWKLGELDRSQEFFDRGLEIAGKLGMEREIGVAHHSLGSAYWFRGEFDTALRHMEKAIEVRERIGDKVGLGGSLLNMGSVYHVKGELDEALKYKMRAYELILKTGDKFGLATALNNLGITYYDRGETGKCLEYYEKSLAIRRQMGDKHGITTVLHNMGVVHNDAGDMEKAIGYFEQALEMGRRIGSKHGMMYELCSLAESLFETGENDRAETCASEALELAIETGAKGEGAWAKRNIAKGQWKRGRWEDALKLLTEALATFEEMGEGDEIPKTYFEMGNFWRERGEEPMARESYERALAGFKAMGREKNTAKVMECMALLGT